MPSPVRAARRQVGDGEARLPREAEGGTLDQQVVHFCPELIQRRRVRVRLTAPPVALGEIDFRLQVKGLNKGPVSGPNTTNCV